MTCPNCSKETSSDKNFCEFCGYSLYGPQSILLNEPELNSNIDKNNLKSITGIDINSINTSAYTPPMAPLNMDSDKKKSSKGAKKIDPKTIILIVLLVVIAGLCAWIMFMPKEKANCEPVKCETPVNNTTTTTPSGNTVNMQIEGHKVYTDNYVFVAPSDFEFYETSGKVILKNSNVTMEVNLLASGSVDIVTSSTIGEKYAGFASLNIEETILNKKKAFLITYQESGNYYLDFYYQQNGSMLVYGQAMSKDAKAVSDSKVQGIIASFTQRDGQSPLTYTPSSAAQDEVLELFK